MLGKSAKMLLDAGYKGEMARMRRADVQVTVEALNAGLAALDLTDEQKSLAW